MSDSRLVTVQEATRALHVSSATLRRWADAGRLASISTPGGHRRFPISEIERLRREMSIVDVSQEMGGPPDRPLPGVAAALAEHGAELMRRATQQGPVVLAAYSGPRGKACVDALIDACRRGDYEHARTVHLATIREAILDGATFAQCIRLCYHFGGGVVESLERAGAGPEELAGWRLLYEYLQESAMSWFAMGPVTSAAVTDEWTSVWPVLDHVHLPCAVVDRAAVVLAANRALGLLTGRDPALLAGRGAGDLLPTRHRPTLERLLNAASEGLADYVGDVRRIALVDGAGDEIVVDVALGPVAGSAGHLLATVTDRRAETNRARELARFRALVDRIPVPAFLVASDLTISSWNAAATALLGYRADEIIGCSVRQLVPAEDSEVLRAAYARVMGGQEVRGVPGRRVASDGRLVEVLIDAVPIQAGTDEPFVGVFLRDTDAPGSDARRFTVLRSPESLD